MGSPTTTVVRQVRPLLSIDKVDARRKVLQLYKLWYRQIPLMVFERDIAITEAQAKRKLREQFERHAHVHDIRTIDMLVIKGRQELQEVLELWKPSCRLLDYWKETIEPKPSDFMSKFLAGHD